MVDKYKGNATTLELVSHWDTEVEHLTRLLKDAKENLEYWQGVQESGYIGQSEMGTPNKREHSEPT